MELKINSKKIKIPNSINILGFTFKIELHENSNKLQDAADIRNDDFTYGCVDLSKQVIYINIDDKKVTEEQILDTLIHECIHAVDDKMKLDLSEETVSRLGSGLTSIFKEMLNWKEVK